MPSPAPRNKRPATDTPAAAALLARLRELGLDEAALAQAAEVGALVVELAEDRDLAGGALLDTALAGSDAADLDLSDELRDVTTPAALQLAGALRRLGEFALDERWSQRQALSGAQAETLRKMLLAVVGDPRLVVARLAQQLVRIRHARDLPDAARLQVALETRDLYAPLANRLGIRTLKWELEDLAFRELEPAEYRRIAAALNERRRDREAYIDAVLERLRVELGKAGLRAEVQGRPKHIYSIWRKMQRKHLAFEQLFDVRAVRIIVDTVPDCYAALGVVHGLWPFLPGEFDDYIAHPKENDYRSIHTAVAGPDGRPLEIQIRTQQMQDEAERGVAAHWRYKEGGSGDDHYARKIAAMRSMLQARAQGEEPDAIAAASATLFSDRVYAMTPKGEVVDLPTGATPLDFAFHVHSDLGQRCKGARVNGRIVPLDHTLGNGDVVEVITARNATPSRDWLAPNSGYLASARSRAKLRAYFRRLDEAAAAPGGSHPVAAPAQALPASAEQPPPRSKRPVRKLIGSGRSPVDIEGVGDLPTTLARCCAPVRPQPIGGYLTLGRGVTIHRADCSAFARMARAKPERRLAVEWSTGDVDRLPIRISIEAFDRRGLLRDISDVIAAAHLSIEGVSSDTDPRDRIARFLVRVGVQDLPELERLQRQLRRIPNVFKVRRAD